MAGSLFLAAFGFLLSAFADSLTGKVLCLVVAAAGIWGGLGPFWALAGSFLTGTAAAGGIALINAIGNLGGFIGPAIMGFFRQWTGSFTTGLLLLGAMIFSGGILALRLPHLQKTGPPAQRPSDMPKEEADRP